MHSAPRPQCVVNLEAATGPATIELGPAELAVDYDVIRPDDLRWEDTYAVCLARHYCPDARESQKKTDCKFPVVRLHVPPAA